jgi:putative hydroxymethylpyrimidine transport system substrate-binding protein
MIRTVGIALAGLVLLASIAPARAADRLTLLLDWYVNPDHAALVIAKERGFFVDEGLDVELVAPSDPNDPPKLVAAGKADVAVTYQPQLVLQVGQGLPLKRFATLVDTPLNSLLVTAEGPVRTVADLKGRKVGYSIAGFEDTLLTVMLKRAGLSPRDVTLVNVNFALVPALLSGQVDAVIGAYRNVELVQMAAQGRPGIAIPVEEAGVPAYDELILVARPDTLADPRLPRLVAAIERGTLYVLNHPDEAWEIFATANPTLADPVNRTSWDQTLRRLAASPGAIDAARYERLARFMADEGLIAQARPASDYAVALPIVP